MTEKLIGSIIFASEKRTITYYQVIDTEAFYSGINKTIDVFSLLKILQDTLTIEFPTETFMVKITVLEETEDYFEENVYYWYKIEKGKLVDKIKTKTSTPPDWYINHEPRALTHTIDCINPNNISSILFSGAFFTDHAELFLSIAYMLYNQLACKYIKYDPNKFFCLKNGVRKRIMDLDEAEKANWFENEANLKNLTNSLLNPFHPELRAIYGNLYQAIQGYNRGEFALYEKYGIIYFYAIWRTNPNISDYKLRYAVFTDFRLPSIKGENEEKNALYQKAQKLFAKDALSFKENGQTYYFGEENGKLIFKIIKKDNEFEKIKFSLSNFFDLKD